MMMKLSDIGIAWKIVAAFAIVLCATICLGLFSIRCVSRVDASAAVLRDTWLPATRALGEVARAVERFRLAQTSTFLPLSDSQMKIVSAEKQEALRLCTKSWSDYAPKVTGAEEKKLVGAVMSAWMLYIKQTQSLGGMDKAAAATFFSGPMAETLTAVRNAVQTDIDFQSASGNAAGNEAAATEQSASVWVLVALGVTGVLCAAIGWGMIRGISAPIAEITKAMRGLADNDLAVTIFGSDRKDEIGAMAKAVQVFKEAAVDKLRVESTAADDRRTADDDRARMEAVRAASSQQQAEVVGSIGEGLRHLADGDLTFRIEGRFAPDYETLRTDFNDAMGEVQKTMAELSMATATIQSRTSDIAGAAEDLSGRTEQQASSLQKTAGALGEITAAIHKTAESASHARTVVGSAKIGAETSGAVVLNAVEAMSAIEASSGKIRHIIGVIDEIAFQTNLLALNAGVEAARAGDAGRGFAVVASEVRLLAQRCADAAKEINALIQTSTKQVSSGVDLVRETGRSLSLIVSQVTEINTIIADIAASAREQSTGLAEINTTVNQIDQVTQSNAAMVEETTTASQGLSAELSKLARLVSRFRVDAKPNAPARRPVSPAPHANNDVAHRRPMVALKRMGGRTREPMTA